MDRDQFTFRAPKKLLDRVREQAQAYGDSMNDLIVDAVRKEVTVREQLRLLSEIERARKAIEARGLQPDSTSTVRQIRTGVDRRE